MPNIRSFYVTVLSQALSPCEEFLAAGTNFGNINIFKYYLLFTHTEPLINIECSILNSTRPLYDEDEANHKSNSTTPSLPQRCLSVSTKPLQAMVTSNNQLIVGGRNSVIGYAWDEIKSIPNQDQELKPSWTVDLHLPT